MFLCCSFLSKLLPQKLSLSPFIYSTSRMRVCFLDLTQQSSIPPKQSCYQEGPVEGTLTFHHCCFALSTIYFALAASTSSQSKSNSMILGSGTGVFRAGPRVGRRVLWVFTTLVNPASAMMLTFFFVLFIDAAFHSHFLHTVRLIEVQLFMMCPFPL